MLASPHSFCSENKKESRICHFRAKILLYLAGRWKLLRGSKPTCSPYKEKTCLTPPEIRIPLTGQMPLSRYVPPLNRTQNQKIKQIKSELTKAQPPHEPVNTKPMKTL